MGELIAVANWLTRVFTSVSQIGNARVAGFEKDTGLSGNQFYYWYVNLPAVAKAKCQVSYRFFPSHSLTIFYIFYILVEIPSNEVFRRFGSMWLAFLVIVFGVVSIATAFVHSLAGVIVTRIFLGLSEGGREL